MHGRVKVRRSVEQDARFRAFEKEKVRGFSMVANDVLESRRLGSHDIALLNKISELLEQSPEAYTFWNYRREILLDPVNIDVDKDARTAMFNNELTVTEKCLLKNQKSYATWYHRAWVMSQHPCPNWNNELSLCNKALKVDDRNFHCWDYRRFVVRSSHTSKSDEIEFTTSSLNENFSNYSAWHYRSGLIGADDAVSTIASPVSPPPAFTVEGKNSEVNLPADEFDMAHNAVFTDPKDQGPWFYYWWLLGRGVKSCYLRELYLSRSLQRAVLVFTSCKLKSTVSQLLVDVVVHDPITDTRSNYTPNDFDGWKCTFNDNISAVWWFELPKSLIDGCVVSVSVHPEESVLKSVTHPSSVESPTMLLKCQMQVDQKESLTRVKLDPRRLLNSMISPVHEPSDLNGELETVRELISLEPRNKWALLTLVSLLRYIRPENFATEVKSAIETLTEIDGQRRRYYTDMTSAHATEDAIVSSFDVNSRSIILTGVGLTRLFCLDWCSLMTELNFSNNDLDSLPLTCAYLVCLRDLNLNDNRISCLKPLAGLPQLKRLSVCHNRISGFEGLEPVLSCPSLRTLDITGNKVAELKNFTVLVAEHPYSKGSHNSLNVVYNKPIVAATDD